jgi:hypothetical protein
MEHFSHELLLKLFKARARTYVEMDSPQKPSIIASKKNSPKETRKR